MGEKLIATNRQARRDYAILETQEAGLELKGMEVKSLRLGKVNLKDSFARIEKGEVLLYNMHISPYEKSGSFKIEPLRVRRLLLNRNQIKRLITQTAQRGFTLIPVKLYFKGGLAKIELALAKGKRLYDKREQIKRRELDRELRRAIRGRKN